MPTRHPTTPDPIPCSARSTAAGLLATTLSRRRLLAGAAVGAGIGLAPTWTAHASAAGSPADHTLVVVFLRGGPDGCSLLVPAGEATYFDRRPGIALADQEVIPFDTEFGLHPAMAPLQGLIDDGRLAAVPACGSTLDTRSHFDQQAHIERGGTDRGTGNGQGWLARLLDTTAGPDDEVDALRAAAMGGKVPPSLAGGRGVVAVADLDGVGPPPFPGMEAAAVDDALRSLHASTTSSLVLTAATGAVDAIPVLLDAAERTRNDGADDLPDGAPYGGGPDAAAVRTFRDLARLVRADIGIDVATVDLGGWDTHDDMGDAEAGRMTGLVATLATALAAFADEAGDAFSRTTVVAMGEFGRRVAENGSGGTDHGRGGVLLAMGGGVRGGRYGAWPGLAPDALVNGDVPVATDWRTVVAEILERSHGLTDVEPVLPGVAADRLGIIA